jgi:hypothetical protein
VGDLDREAGLAVGIPVSPIKRGLVRFFPKVRPGQARAIDGDSFSSGPSHPTIAHSTCSPHGTSW